MCHFLQRLLMTNVFCMCSDFLTWHCWCVASIRIHGLNLTVSINYLGLQWGLLRTWSRSFTGDLFLFSGSQIYRVRRSQVFHMDRLLGWFLATNWLQSYYDEAHLLDRLPNSSYSWSLMRLTLFSTLVAWLLERASNQDACSVSSWITFASTCIFLSLFLLTTT